MRRSNMKKLAWMLMLVLPCFSQTISNEKTLGGLNGRFWETLTPSDRLWFIIGLHEGLEYAEARMPSYFPGVPYGDVLKGVDRFYEEPENLTFPVLYALEVFALKVNGATQSEIEKNLAERRQRIKEMELAIKKKGEGK
jgi:hypothetical protein